MINKGNEEENKEKMENTNIQNDDNALIKIDLNKPDITKIILLKKEGVPFKKDTNIAKYYLNNNKEKPKYIKSPIYGWILKYISDEKKLILECCKHDTFYVNLCVKCGFKKTEQYDIQNQTKGYGFLTSDFTYSKGKAESLEKSAVKNYLKEEKLILLLDLDNTIIHTSQIRILPEDIKFLQDMYKDYFAKVPIKNEFNRNDLIFVKFRPFLKTFLKNIKNKYEIFIYTQGTKEYATAIIQYINLNFEGDSLSTNRMMYRVLDENGFAKNKSIKNVFPTQENMILIIDDHIEVWKESGDNFICIYPYKFFTEKEKTTYELVPFNGKNIIKEKFLKYEYDNVLFCITNLLLCVHRKFFEFYSKLGIQKSIKRITNDLLMTIFHGKKFYYHLNYFNCPVVKTNKKTKKSKDKNNNNTNTNTNTNELPENKNNKNETNISDNNNKISDKDKDNINNKEKKEDNDNKIINNTNEDNKCNNEKDIKDDTNNNIKMEEENIEIEKKEKKRNLDEEKFVVNALKNKIAKLGGILIDEEKNKFEADIFLTDFYDEKDPVIKSIEENNSDEKNKKIPILHCHYIEICLMYFHELCIDDFILSQNLKILKYLNLNKIFEKNKVNIINFYGNKEFIDEN